MIKKLFFGLMLIFTCNNLLFSQTVTLSYSFEMPDIKDAGNGYSELLYKNCNNYGFEGNPLMPYFSANVLIPYGSEIVKIKVISEEYFSPEYEIAIKQAPRRLPVSHIGNEIQQVDPNPEIYNSTSIYPAHTIENLSTYLLSGHSIGTFTLCPVQYIPANKKVKFLKHITLQVETKASANKSAAGKMLKSNPAIEKQITGLVDNPGFLSNYTYPKSGKSIEYDLLLITSQALLPHFNEYINFKNQTGYTVLTKTTEDIYAEYQGIDNPEKIRNCIIDIYTNNNLSWVILGGDADSEKQNIVPCRYLYSDPGYSGYADKLPADIYYSCLDGNWNNDNDVKWGEPGEEDLFYEVAVGRLCVDNAIEIQNFVNKLILYQDKPVVGDLTKALFVGEQLDGSTFGDASKEEIDGITASNGYITHGVNEDFTISRLYESVAMWDVNDMFNAFNNGGINLLNNLGHANVQICMKITNSDITTANFRNNGIDRSFVIGYSQGCYSGSFDNRTTEPNVYLADDCFAEQITTIATGQVAAIANSRYGWYDVAGTNGPSQYFDRQFFDAIFGEGITKIGDANADAKQDNASYINLDPVKRWCAYASNLFGDPTMDIWTNIPTDIAADFISCISTGLTEISFTTDAPFARIGLMQNDTLIGRGIADSSGNCAVQLFNPLISTLEIEVAITAHNRNKFQSILKVYEDQSFVALQSVQISDAQGNKDGIIDFNETISLTISMKEFGVEPINSVQVTLTTTDEYVTITDATELYGDFEPEEVKSITDGFTFTTAANIPDNHEILFQLTAKSGSNWISTFNVTAHAAIIEKSSFSINDSASGNGNGVAEKGETFELAFYLKNTGSALSSELYMQLSFNDSNLTLLSSASQNYGKVNAGDSVARMFTLHASANTPNGYLIPLSFLVSDEFELLTPAKYNLFIGSTPVGVFDLDKNNNSGPAIQSALINNGVKMLYDDTIPSDLSTYKSLFVCLGVNTKKHKLTAEEGQRLADFVEAGGNLYMEGGDTWFYDPKTAVHPKFNANGTSDGSSDLSSESGETGQFTEGLNFDYIGDKEFIDHLAAIAPAFPLFNNDTPTFVSAVAYNAGTYRTIASAFEFGGLKDGENPSTRNEYMRRIIDFFDILSSPYKADFMGTPMSIKTGSSVNFFDFSSAGTTSWEWSFPGGEPSVSTEQNPIVTYPGPGLFQVTLSVSDGSQSNTLAKVGYVIVESGLGISSNNTHDFVIYPNPTREAINITSPDLINRIHIYNTLGTLVDMREVKATNYRINSGNLSEGLYILKIETDNGLVTKRVSVIK